MIPIAAIAFVLVFAGAVALTALYAAPGWVVRTGLEGTRRKAGLRRGTRRLGEDSVMTYLEGGAGETVVMLHGFGADKDIFVPFARRFRGAYRMVIPDLFAFGEASLPPSDSCSLAAEADRLHALLRLLEAGRVHLVGNSMGGQLALFFAARFPEAVRTLTLISPSGLWQGPQSDLMRRLRDAGDNPLIVRSVAAFRESMATGMLRPPRLPHPMLAVLAQPRIAGADAEERLFAMLLDTPVDGLLETIDAPLLALSGAHDRVIDPSVVAYVQQHVPGAQTCIIPDAAHVAMYEQPEATARCCLDFMRSAGVPS